MAEKCMYIDAINLSKVGHGDHGDHGDLRMGKHINFS